MKTKVDAHSNPYAEALDFKQITSQIKQIKDECSDFMEALQDVYRDFRYGKANSKHNAKVLFCADRMVDLVHDLHNLANPHGLHKLTKKPLDKSGEK